MMLRFAVAPEIQSPTRSPAKSKPNEGVLMVSGNQIGSHPRTHLGIPLWRRMRLSMESQLANLVRIASLKSYTPYSLTGRTLFFFFFSFIGQKRPPLPPQKSLYKESINSHVREPPPAQFPETDGPPSRQNGHGHDPPSRSRNPEPQPPSGPGGRRGRAGDSRKPPRPEPMDVDPPAPVHPPRVQESRSVSNAAVDRDDTKGDLPRGPKAMKLPPAPPTSLPPKPTAITGRYSGRSPPPHLIAHEERPTQRAGDRVVVDPHSDRHRDVARDHHTPEIAPPRRRSPDSVRIP